MPKSQPPRATIAGYFSVETNKPYVMKVQKTSPFKNILRVIGVTSAVAALTVQVAQAHPYASGVTNNGSGTMSFYLNEAGGNVTIVYTDDGSTNSSYNGVTTGTNLTAGAHTFALGTHTNYTITVFKTGSGAASLIASSPAFTPRGVDINRNPASKYFGHIYVSRVSSPNGLYAFNSDFSTITGPNTAGIGFQGGNAFEPYRIYVGDDDYLYVGDAGYDNAGTGTLQDGVWRVDPTLSSSQLFLGPAGFTAGNTAGVHGTPGSRPFIVGNVQAGGPVTLFDVDMDFSALNGFNSLLVYTNITLAGLPFEQPPAIQGPEVGLPISGLTLGGNPYPGMQVHGNYIYTGTYRDNYSNPQLQIYTNDVFTGGTLAKVWDSTSAAGGTVNVGPDWFTTTVAGLKHGTCDIAVSPDGRYVAGASIDNWFVICPLTNGLPDTANLYTTTPTSFSGNARGLSFDAADNLYLSSSGIGLVQSWSLGLTTTAITTGNTNGSYNFQLILPATSVNVAATTPNASQGGVNGVPGTPIPGVFTITRTNANNDYSSQVTVNFVLSGTATNGVYTTSPSTGITVDGAGTVVLPPGVLTTNISIIPTTNNVPRLTTTAIITLGGGAAYSVTQPSAATVLIQNTSSNQLVVTAGAPTMYKAFANDFASLTLTRLGDTNAANYSTAAFTYAGTAQVGVDFTAIPAVAWNQGDITHVPQTHPLSNGVPPVDVANPAYSGNKIVTVTLPAGSQYTVSSLNSGTLTLIDNANPTEPVLFSDPLTDPTDANNWGVTFGSGNETSPFNSDYTVQFGYDLTINNPDEPQNGLIGLPPNGATNALRITCLKNVGTSYAGGVNVYYTNQAFSGNYAVRFNMNLVEGDGTFSVEGVSFGVNHNGNETNWWLGNGSTSSGPWASDGVWYWIQAPPGGAGGFGFNEFEEYTGLGGVLPNTGWTQLATTTASAQQNVYKHVVYTAPGGVSGGTPANNSPVSATPADNSWSDVEIKQVNNVVTMSVNKTPLFVYTNTTTFTNGYLMLGYDCPIQGAFNQYVGTPDAAAYFSNLRVVSIARPFITAISDVNVLNTNNVIITFQSNDGDDSASSFALQGTGTNQVPGPYADIAGATITQVYTNSNMAVFQASTSLTNVAQFFRIRHK